MHLYSTNLYLQYNNVPYEVYKEGDRLFFKPLRTYENVDTPIFWVGKTDGEWTPINIQDERFIKQVRDDIASHDAELTKAYGGLGF